MTPNAARRWSRTPCLALTLALAGCATSSRTDPVSTPSAIRLSVSGLAVEFAPAIDRYTYFGPSIGPNLLHTTALDQPPKPDGSYTFFGGCYTWNSPQNAPVGPGGPGWIGPDGAPLPWPPDPAMDVGPARRTAATTASFTTTGPLQRLGLIEEKTVRITGATTAEMTYRMLNAGAEPRTAGLWITTAADPEGMIALRMPEGAEVWGWDARSVELFRSIASAPDERGWVALDLRRSNWNGGIKVYISAPGGQAGPVAVEIATWREGHWFHRAQPALTADQAARLREMGEGPVAVYIEPQSRIVEAELYSPIADLAPGAATFVTELWSVVAARRADVSKLP